MGEPMVTDEMSNKKSTKRKRATHTAESWLSKEEISSRIGAFRVEIEGLFGYFKEVLEERRGKIGMDLWSGGINAVIAVLLEGSGLPLSRLVEEICEKMKERVEGEEVSVSSVRSSVLLIGQRSVYGVMKAVEDVFEDDSESCLWCWETKDVKLIPKAMRGSLKIWRICRKKIHERITAVSAMISVLQKCESERTCRQEFMKASERLGKVLSEADIRALISSMVEKNGAEMAEKEGKREKDMLIKQMEKQKREAEKEKKRLDLELQKEKLQSEKELRRLQDEAEREEKRRQKEESDLRKQLRRQQEEAERDQRRREKEEAELKRQLALQKQASLMERFLNKSKNSSPPTKEPSPAKIMGADTSCIKSERMVESVTQSMDSALSQYDETDTENIWKLHLDSWRRLGHSIRSEKKEHWGLRRTPKTELVKELKLTTTRYLHYDDELNSEKMDDGWGESCKTNSECSRHHTNSDGQPPTGRNFRRKKQLLQFDKSHRPAFYGIWPKQSRVVGPRHPFAQDPDLDYEIDSDEEWEEEEPGESLSDCDKDDEEESLEEGIAKAEEDESEDGFFVPDGYLSENEGVQEDKMECDDLVEGAPSSKQMESEDLSVFFRQQKYLHNATEQALRRNKPLIISNLLHQKVQSAFAEDLTSTPAVEQTCLLALSMRGFPGCPSMEISVLEDVEEENVEASPPSSNGNATPVSTATAVPDSDLPQIVAIIQSCSQSINKVVESLHAKFPTVSKTHLRIKVREMSDFIDNRWQVKKDVLNKLGLSPSPEKSGGKTKSIVSFFSKRCLPPVGKGENSNNASPQSQSSQKPESSTQLHPNPICKHQ